MLLLRPWARPTPLPMAIPLAFLMSKVPASENARRTAQSSAILQPVYATGVTVQETDGNGFVYQVDLLDTHGNLHTVFTGPDNTQPGAPAGLDIPIPQTSYLVQGVKVYVNTDHDLNNYEEIDAVQLQGITANDLTLHAHTGSIGGAVSTTTSTTYQVPLPPGNSFPTPQLPSPAGSTPALRLTIMLTGSMRLKAYPIFTVSVDGTPSSQTGTLDPITGDGSVDLEADVPASDASLPALHSITVQLTEVFMMVISGQTVTTTIPNGGTNDPIDATAGGTLNLITDAGNGAGNIFVLSGHSLTLQQNVFTTTGSGHNSIGLETTAGDITVPSSEPSVLANDLLLIAAGSVNLPTGLSLTAPGKRASAPTRLNIDLTQTYTATIGDLTLKSGRILRQQLVATAGQGQGRRKAGIRHGVYYGGRCRHLRRAATPLSSPCTPQAGGVGTSARDRVLVEITTTTVGITLAAASETRLTSCSTPLGPSSWIILVASRRTHCPSSRQVRSKGTVRHPHSSRRRPRSSAVSVFWPPPIYRLAPAATSRSRLPVFHYSMHTRQIRMFLAIWCRDSERFGNGRHFHLQSRESLLVTGLTPTPGHNVEVLAAGLTTSFSAGLTGDNVTLETNSQPAILRNPDNPSATYVVGYIPTTLDMHLPSSSSLDFGNGSLRLLATGQIEFDGPPGSITGTGPLLLTAEGITRNSPGSGTGLNLTNSTGCGRARLQQHHNR